MNNKIFLLPDRLAHYREPVFLELGKLLRKKSKKLYLFFDPSDEIITQIPMPKLSKLKSLFKTFTVRNIYVGKVVIFQFNVIGKYFSIRPDILIAWGESQRISTFILMLAAFFFRKKVILWTHGFYGNERLIKKIWRINFYRFANKILVYGEYGASLLKKYLPNKEIYVIGNSININKLDFKFYDDKSLKIHKQKIINKYKLIEKPLLLDPKTIILSFVGRLTKSKNLNLLIRLLKADNASNIKLWIIGKGPEEENLKNYALHLGVYKNIHFFGEIYNQEEVNSILSASDIFACPRNLGLSICNALSAGIPVITTNNPKLQMPEYETIRNFEYADFIDFEDTDGLLQKINFTFKKVSADFESRYKIVNHFQNSFDPSKHAGRIFDSISELIE